MNPSFAFLSDAISKLHAEAQLQLNQESNLLQEREEILKKDEETLKQQIQKMKQFNFKETELIELNVGGHIYCTTLSTLRTIPPNLFSEEDQQGPLYEERQTATDEGNILSIIASDNFPLTKDKKGRIFLDRDGTHFIYILNYLRENGDWERSCIPLDKEVIKKLCIECDHYCLNRMKYLLLHNGNIVSHWINKSDWTWLTERVSEMNKKIGSLLYRGSRDGFTAAAFHQLCDNQGETISIIKSNLNNIFGGYNSNHWKSQQCYSFSSTNWLFCFANHIVEQPMQFKLNGNKNHKASNNHSSFLLGFGGGSDLKIYDNCNTNDSNYNSIGNTYDDNGIQHALNGGINSFTVVEIEVYQITSK